MTGQGIRPDTTAQQSRVAAQTDVGRGMISWFASRFVAPETLGRLGDTGESGLDAAISDVESLRAIEVPHGRAGTSVSGYGSAKLVERLLKRGHCYFETAHSAVYTLIRSCGLQPRTIPR